MSRVEENAKLHLPNSFRDDIQVQIAQAKFLEDISRSLAVIADVARDNGKTLSFICIDNNGKREEK